LRPQSCGVVFVECGAALKLNQCIYIGIASTICLLITQKANAQEKPVNTKNIGLITNIPRLSDIERPPTSVKDWLSQSAPTPPKIKIIVSYSARIVSALITGLLIVKLGRTKSLIIFGIMAALSTLLYIIPAIGVSSLLVIYTVCIVVNGTQSMAYTSLLSAMMDKCEKNTAATDYTIQVSVMFLGGIAATVLSGMLATTMGYSFIFIMSAAVSLLSVFLITKKYGVTS
jgi:uncharacterized membrane protein YuzA (DUF378 family)